MQTVTLTIFDLPHERYSREQRKDAPIKMSPNVLTCGHHFPEMLLQSSALSSALGSRGSDDNQNFGGGLDGVSRLVFGKSIPGLCATAETVPKKTPESATI